MDLLRRGKSCAAYNVMGVAKAALDSERALFGIRPGPNGIRVNAISAGPSDACRSEPSQGWRHAQGACDRAPLKRNVDPGESAERLRSCFPTQVRASPAKRFTSIAGYNIMGF